MTLLAIETITNQNVTMAMEKKLFIYILECSDGTFYTGVTNNLDRRLSEHNEGISPKSYTFPRRPVKVVFSEEFTSPIDALEAEKQVKGWSRKKKQALIEGNFQKIQELAKRQTPVKKKKR